MDRDAIERRDFPVGRRGYDQAAVDAHLRRVADEIEALRASPGARPGPAPLSAGTSEQVRAILEAAETGAAEIRAQAGREAGDHVARVEEAAGDMLARLGELENGLNRLLDGLAELHRRVGEFGAAPASRDDDLAPAAGDHDAAPAADDLAPAADDSPPAADASPPAADDLAPAPAASTPNGDEAGARLIALNMALSGTPREETARYLAEHYSLPDADALLDDVYSRAGR